MSPAKLHINHDATPKQETPDVVLGAPPYWEGKGVLQSAQDAEAAKQDGDKTNSG